MSTNLELSANIAEPRVAKNRLVVSADGSTWDYDTLFGGDKELYIEPLTGLMMLMPLPLSDDWETNFSGNYARYGKANYNLSNESDWVEFGRTDPFDRFLQYVGDNPAGQVVTTVDEFEENQAMYIACVVAGTGTENRIILECGWGPVGAPNTISLRFRANGETEVYKGTARVGSYNFRNFESEVFKRVKPKRKKKKRGTSGTTLAFTLIPRPARSLIVLSNGGGGFEHTFGDLDYQVAYNTITSQGAFFWRVPSGLPVVQCAPVRYETSGVVYSPVINLRYAPSADQAFTGTVADGYFANTVSTVFPSLVKPDGSAFTPNGVQKQVRLKASIVGDGLTTRFLYAVDMVTPRTTTSTYNAPFNLTDDEGEYYCTKLSLEVPEDGPAQLRITCKSPKAMEAAGLAKARVVGDIPVRLRINGKDIFRGTTGKPMYSEAPGYIDQATVIEWIAEDREKEFDEYVFLDTFPYDGLGFSNSVKQLAKLPGYTDDDLDVTEDTFILPFSTDVSFGKWQLLPKRGDTVGQWLKKMRDDFAGNWVRGWTPTATGYKYRFRRPDTLSETPLMELFESDEGAAAFGIPADWITRRVVRSMKIMREFAPANQVSVIGYNEGTDTYPQAQYDDAASQNPALAPAARPDNWRGRVHSYQYIDSEILTNQAVVDRARDILIERATKDREIIEIDCDFLIRASTDLPLWKGDVVRIYKHYEGEKEIGFSGKQIGTYEETEVRGDYRILSIPSVEFMLEGEREVPIRPATYRLIKIGPGTTPPGG